LGRLGYEVTIFESKKEAGGLDTHGIVPFRLPKDISLWEVEQVENVGVEIRTNTEVGKDISADELINNYDAVILTVCMSKVPMLGIEGEDLAAICDAIELVEETKNKKYPHEFAGKRVAVIGAGNTAIDGATTSVRLGADNVQILYRRTEAEMTAYDFEYEFAKQDGVEFRWLTAPKRLIGDENGRLKQMECVRMELQEAGNDGRRRPVEIKGSEFVMDVDILVKAIGQTRHRPIIEAFDLEHNGDVVKVDAETYLTSNRKVYAAGDVIFGKGIGEAMVVTAAQQGKDTAYGIHQQLMGSKTAHAYHGKIKQRRMTMADLSINFAGIKTPHSYWLASAPPTNTGYPVQRAIEAGWGGAVWKTLGEPVLNVTSRFGAHHFNGQRVAGFNNIELISDRPIEDNLKEIYETKKRFPDRAI